MSKWYCWLFVLLFVTSALSMPSIASGEQPGALFPDPVPDPILVSFDEPAPETDPDHNSDPGADLTYQWAWLEGSASDTLVVTLDFATIWTDVHLIVILERDADAAGAASDAFEFPVTYGHANKPDYVFTYKYSANDYADLRRWRSDRWEFWKPATNEWTSNPEDANKNSLELVTKAASTVQFKFPASAIGAIEPNDTLRIQSYVTQEPVGDKYTALDSNPHDATHDMLPDTGNWWETATNPVSLSVYAEHVLPSFGSAPAVSQASAAPNEITAGEDVLFTVRVADTGGGIGSVLAELTALGGGRTTGMYDDGTNGDVTPSDGVYSVSFSTAGDISGGMYTIPFVASDSTSIAWSLSETQLTVISAAEVFLSADDAIGDDHGPNRPGEDGLYYHYPTNSVFKNGVFDIEKADFLIDGRHLLLRVYLGDVASNAEVGWGAPNPGTKCGNPNKAQLNMQKIDVYMDSDEEAGSIIGYPDRYVDIAPWDAWDFGAVADGWWVSLNVSNNSDNIGDWTKMTGPNKVHICNDYVEDFVEIFMSLEALGLLEVEEDLDAAKLSAIRAELKTWDYMIAISGHDGDSDANNLGGSRPVNPGIAEWQFGGGSGAVGGREPDPNLLDVLVIPGEGKGQGRAQEDMLNYKTPEAEERFGQGLNSCYIEAQAQFAGMVTGTATLSDPTDVVSVVTVTASSGDLVVSTAQTAPGGGEYRLSDLPDDSYSVAVSAPFYTSGTVQQVTIADGGQVDGIDFDLDATTGTIAGTVVLEDPSDQTTVIRMTAFRNDMAEKWVDAPPGGGDYEIRFLEPGPYTIEASGRGYRTERIEDIDVAANDYIPDQDFSLEVVTGAVMGSMALSGPAMDVRMFLRDSGGDVLGDTAMVIAGGGLYEIINLEDGSYTLFAEARGYARFDSLFTVSGGDTSDIIFTLNPAVATKYVFIDSVIDVAHSQTFDPGGLLGNEIYSVGMSRSVPEDTIYFFAQVMFEPRDAGENSAIFDASAQDSVLATPTLLDPDVPTRGEVLLADSANYLTRIPDNLLSTENFIDGVGRFYVADDSIEVVRLDLERNEAGGAIEVGVGELKPAAISLSVDKISAEVGGEDRIEVSVQLVDIRGNAVPTAAVPIRMVTIDGSPSFDPEASITDANGYFRVFLTSDVSGLTIFTAQAEPGLYEGLPSIEVVVLFNPGPPEEFTARLAPGWAKLGGKTDLELQLADAFGNAVEQAGVSVDLEALPAELLESLDTPVVTDALGAAVSTVRAGDRYGIVSISGSSDYPVPGVNLKIDARLVAVDEEAPESDNSHNSDPGADLTTLFGWTVEDTFKVRVDFTSSWSDVLLMVILETKNDQAGASADAFEQPIFYRHTKRPDYVFTTKYSAEDYADLRRWNSSTSSFEFWTGSAWGDGGSAIGMVNKTPYDVTFNFPMDAIGQVSEGDTVRMEAYVSQELSTGEKYNALDSTPHDATHDMLPRTGDWWETATRPVSLSKYGEFVLPATATPPDLSDPTAEPDSVQSGDEAIFSVRVQNAGGGIGDVFANLAALGGETVTRLNDMGMNGDASPGDNLYTTEFTIPAGVEQGDREIFFVAKDILNILESTISTTIKVTNPPEFILTVLDEIGDDHGPNVKADNGNPVDGLYYFYPTNGVFDKGTWDPSLQTYVGGVYDLERVDLFIDGSFLVFRIKVGNVPTSEEIGWNAPNPGPTCTNEFKADFNLQKIDIYIDSKEGAGATAGLPFRFVDVSKNDAWEYAIAVEGWYRSLIISNGENSISFWTLRKQTNQVDFCNDFVEDIVDVKVALASIGNPTVEDIKKWDFIVTMHSHDGESNDQNLGGSRWVNQGTSEWNFGGGREGEAGRERDPNLMDLVTIVGAGKDPGRPQEEMLNYLLSDAISRFDSGRAACIIEATFSEDISPPVILPFPTEGFAHNPWYVLEHCPAAFFTAVLDQSSLDRVEFYWRPLGQSALNSVDMVEIYEDIWIADIDPDELRSAVPSVMLVDGTMGKPFEARIAAEDEYGNMSQSSLFTFTIPDENLTEQKSPGLQPGFGAIFYDGTIMFTSESWVAAGAYDSLDITLTPLGRTGQNTIDVSGKRSTMNYLDVTRRIEVNGYKNGTTERVDTFGDPLSVALHYPSYEVPSDPKRIGMFEYEESANRWITLYGKVNELGNAIAADLAGPGTYGLFTDSRLSYDLSEGLSGVMAEPNPFSPNDDGLYDFTRIGFYLARDADWVTVEIYDISGKEVRTITWQQGLTLTGRNSFELIWDGKDDDGKNVPYGIYIARLEVRFKVSPFNERENISIVVIR